MKINYNMLKLAKYSIVISIVIGIMANSKKTSISKSTKTILFVGSSFTYTNDLPKIVERLAKVKGVKVITTMLALPNYALEDHWKNDSIKVLIKNNKFDYVVLQQGPSSQNDGRTSLFEYGAKFQELCTINKTKLAFFMVWPSIRNFQTFDGVIKNYTDAAIHNKAILCPVGQIWKKHILETNDYSYYDEDELHPSLKGSEVAAQVIVDSLFK